MGNVRYYLCFLLSGVALGWGLSLIMQSPEVQECAKMLQDNQINEALVELSRAAS